MKAKSLCLLVILCLVSNVLMPFASTVYAEQTSSDVENMVQGMTLRDKITQMMMVDFRKWGDSADEAVDFKEMNEDVRKIVEDYNFGAVILFSNNVRETEQTLILTQSLQDAAMKNGGVPLIIATDQEGGTVSRLGSGTALPGNSALGATYAVNGTKYAKEAGKIIGSELSALGINTNLAPVVDINNNANNPIIGLRSFGDDPDMVGKLASAVISGMAEYSVVGTAKHFPGHGDTAEDSHYALPVVDKPFSELRENELKPYDIAISEGIEMIMTAHILYPQLEGDKIKSNKTGELESLPATMSDDILTKLLKGDMGFDGIVITDAMNMEGITKTWDPIQAVTISIRAGVDMICMPTRIYCNDDLAALDDIIEGIENAVQDGSIEMSRIDDAVTRILTVKHNRGILDYDSAKYSLDNAKAVVGCEANRNMEREIAASAITLIKNQNNTLPLKLDNNSRVLMVVAYKNESASTIMAWNRAKEMGIIPNGAKVDYYRLSADALEDGEFVPDLQTKLDSSDTLIIISECSSISHMGYKHWLSAIPNQICDYAKENGKTSVIISVDKPYDVQLYPNADAILAAYSSKGSSVDPEEALTDGITSSKTSFGPNIIAAVEVALGSYSPQGRIPLNIPVYDAENDVYTQDIAYKRGYGLSYPDSGSVDEKGEIPTVMIAGISIVCILLAGTAVFLVYKVNKKRKIKENIN